MNGNTNKLLHAGLIKACSSDSENIAQLEKYGVYSGGSNHISTEYNIVTSQAHR